MASPFGELDRETLRMMAEASEVFERHRPLLELAPEQRLALERAAEVLRYEETPELRAAREALARDAERFEELSAHAATLGGSLPDFLQSLQVPPHEQRAIEEAKKALSFEFTPEMTALAREVSAAQETLFRTVSSGLLGVLDGTREPLLGVGELLAEADARTRAELLGFAETARRIEEEARRSDAAMTAFLASVGERWRILEGSFLPLAGSFSALREEARSGIVIPDFVLEISQGEFRRSTRLHNALLGGEPAFDTDNLEDEQNHAELEELLALHFSDLYRHYWGARVVFRPWNPERVGHVSRSYRELMKHLLTRVAPDDRVRAWIGDDRSYYWKGTNIPTRRARLLWLADAYSSRVFPRFTLDDVENFFTTLDCFENGTHEEEYTDLELEALIARADGILLSFVRIWLERQ